MHFASEAFAVWWVYLVALAAWLVGALAMLIFGPHRPLISNLALSFGAAGLLGGGLYPVVVQFPGRFAMSWAVLVAASLGAIGYGILISRLTPTLKSYFLVRLSPYLIALFATGVACLLFLLISPAVAIFPSGFAVKSAEPKPRDAQSDGEVPAALEQAVASQGRAIERLSATQQALLKNQSVRTGEPAVLTCTSCCCDDRTDHAVPDDNGYPWGFSHAPGFGLLFAGLFLWFWARDQRFASLFGPVDETGPTQPDP